MHFMAFKSAINRAEEMVSHVNHSNIDILITLLVKFTILFKKKSLKIQI